MMSGYIVAAIFIGLVVLVAVGLGLWRRIDNRNAQKWNAIGTILGASVGVLALCFVGYQALQLKRQIELYADEFHLEHRPYVYLYLKEPKLWMNRTYDAWFGGGQLFFKNVGKDPATIVDSEYMVASDRLGDTHFVKWFEEAYGGFPDISVIMPGQDDAQVPCHPIIARADKRPRLMYIGAVITYTGPSAGRKYWYKFSQLFVIRFEEIKDQKGNAKLMAIIQPHKPDHRWDENRGLDPPKLVEPNSQEYLSKTYIKTLTEH